MNIKIVIFMLSLTTVFAEQFCSYNDVLIGYKRGTYDFSVELLDRVSQETDAHFVFSPMSTWLQLITLAEGARGSTKREIWKVTRYHRNRCYQRKFREILNGMYEQFKYVTKRRNVIAINQLLNVKKSFINETLKKADTNILLLNFNEAEEATDKVNEIIQANMDGVIDEVITEDDFKYTVFLMADTAYFKSDWLRPFNPAYTSTQLFYSEENVEIGEVEMMKNIGYYNIIDVPFVNATVLEMVFNARNRLSMLIFLPKEGSVRDIYYKMKDIRLNTVINLFKTTGPRLVAVNLPRFKITTVIESIPELVYDMGVKRVFYPDLADLRGISDFKMHASSMSQTADIEVSEEGAKVITAEYLIQKSDRIDFVVNRPFAFLIVDWKTEMILYAGTYSKPSIFNNEIKPRFD